MKQIIVMRTDLGMRKGKMIAQGAHASLGAVAPFLRSHPALIEGELGLRQYHHVEDWMAGPFKKICVRAGSEEELLAVHDKAREAGLIACLITDSGLTEFGGVPTKTCCALGPAPDEELDPITGELALL